MNSPLHLMSTDGVDEDWVAGMLEELEIYLGKVAAFEDFYTNRKGDAA